MVTSSNSVFARLVSTASWKPVPLKPIKGEEPSSCAGRWMKAMSPASMQMPTMNSWDMGFQPGPPHLPPTPQGGPVPYNSNYGEGGPGPGPGPHFQGTADFLGPLSHMSDNIAANDMVSVEKQLNQAHAEQQLNHGPPHHPPRVPSHGMDQGSQPLRHPDSGTPVSSGNNPSTPSMPTTCNSSQPLNHAPPQPNNKQASNNSAGDNANNQLSHNTEIGNDLNFDPAAIIEGEGQGQEGLDLLPENIGDPMELLSYLGPHDGSGATTGNNANNNNDDLLSLFDS